MVGNVDLVETASFQSCLLSVCVWLGMNLCPLWMHPIFPSVHQRLYDDTQWHSQRCLFAKTQGSSAMLSVCQLPHGRRVLRERSPKPFRVEWEALKVGIYFNARIAVWRVTTNFMASSHILFLLRMLLGWGSGLVSAEPTPLLQAPQHVDPRSPGILITKSVHVWQSHSGLPGSALLCVTGGHP